MSAVKPIVVYVGSYTRKRSKGIYRATIDPITGEVCTYELAGSFENPSFLARHPKLPVVYAVSETSHFNGREGYGGVGAFLIGNEGKLTPLGSVASGGERPCYVSITHDGRTLLVANYASGSVASFRLADNGAISALVSVDQHTGRSRHPSRQDGPHAHSVLPAPQGQFAIGADLGTDIVYTYEVDANTSAIHRVGQATAKPGSGPRHVAFHSDGRVAYVVDELANQVTAFDYQPLSGALSPRQTLSTLPPEYAAQPSTVSEVAVHPSGKFLYVANRGHDSIAHFSIDSADGTLASRGCTLVRGKEPRHFAVVNKGLLMVVANQASDSISVFRIDPAHGTLTFLSKREGVDSPAHILADH